MRARPACAALVAVQALVVACAADVGDLGRPRPSLWNSDVLPTAGYYSAWARGEQVSPFHLTDDEVELRDRAWRFVMPAHERSWFLREVQELARTRIIPVSWQSVDPDRYRVALLSVDFRSETSRYRRLAEDIVADTALIAPFRKMAQRVAAADRVRIRTAAVSPAVTAPMPEHADARVAENQGLVAWVRERTRHRLQSYRHALDNLVVEMPSREAIMTERALLALEQEIKQFDGLVDGDYQVRKGEPIRVRG
jgi:hypothetical protein